MKGKLLLFLTLLFVMEGMGTAHKMTGAVIQASTDDPVIGADFRFGGILAISSATSLDG